MLNAARLWNVPYKLQVGPVPRTGRNNSFKKYFNLTYNINFGFQFKKQVLLCFATVNCEPTTVNGYIYK